MVRTWNTRKVPSRLVQFIAICLLLLSLFQIFEALFHLISSWHFHEVCSSYEPIDVVYTWVNGSDPVFLEDLKETLKTSDFQMDEKTLNQRFDDKDELKFSLRSLEKFAPWVNHVYIVTNGQIPYWLDLDYEKVSIVTHRDIFLDQRDLPTFSSPAIESHLHKIPGLSKKFLYFNDDIFLGQPIHLSDFISPNNGYMLYLSYSLGMCAPQCFWAYVADDQCDESCNNFYCQFDGGDCDKPQVLEDEDYYETDKFNFNNSRKIKTVNGILKKETSQTAVKFNSFRIPEEPGSNKNYTIVVDEYNRKLIGNEKAKRKRFKRRQLKLRAMKTSRRNIENMNTSNVTRCTYGESLQYSNRLFNYKYGFMPRFVPSHTPILIDRDIIDDLQRKFFKEVLITSRNKLRSHNDLQYSFSYYYFIFHEKEEFNIGKIFNEFDTDASGTWSDREIRTLLTRIYQLPLSYAVVESFESILLNCSENKVYDNIKTPEFERYIDSRLPTITKDLVVDCPDLLKTLETNFGTRKKYKYQVVKNSGSQYIYFKQLQSNLTDVVGHLDEIRSEPKKFICLNDNLDYSKTSTNEFITSIMYDFYMSLFPFPSKFELPKEYRNRFLHVDELNDWKIRHFVVKLCVYFIVLFIFYLIGFNLCVKKICFVINRLFY